jgi:hypothetical protein
MATSLFVFALTVAGLASGAAIRETLLSMRNRRGLYGWSRPVQALICIADGIPLSSVGAYPDQEAFMVSFEAAMARLDG